MLLKFIKFLNTEQAGASKIHLRLCAVYGEDNVMVVHNVYKWVEMFNGERTSTHNDARNGRLLSTVSDEAVNIARTLLSEDQC